MRLRHRRGSKPLAPVVVMALRAGEIELALAELKEFAAGLDEGPRALILGDLNRQPLGLARHIGGKRKEFLALMGKRARLRKEFLALMGKRARLLLLGAAQVDALLDVDRPAAR